MQTYVKGIYRRAIFTSEKGYIIGILKVKETNDDEIKSFIGKTITFTGYFHELTIDDMYEFIGSSIEHPKYGFQFAVESYERLKPNDKEGIILFLSSNLFKGVGEKLATKIVEHLGENTLDRMTSEPECLNLVPGLTKKKADQILKTLMKYEEGSATIVYLTDLGFSMKDALSIYHTYKDRTISKIEYNIYDLIEDVGDLSFLKVDTVAHKLDIKEVDARRIKATILYKMKEHTYKYGDTYMTKDRIYEEVCSYLGFSILESDFEQYLKELYIDDKIIIDIEDYYLKNIYDAERNLIYKITKLLKKDKENFSNLEKLIHKEEKINGITYSDNQKKAICQSLENHIFLITGGPGTGKTTIIKAILNIYIKLYDITEDDASSMIALLAPTGRASKRMADGTQFSASTIHRFLKWNKENNAFAINELNKSKSKLIIIDEMSMIDLELMDHLCKGITDDVKLIMVGDFNQLPPVGPGQILKDLIESHQIERMELDVLYRQKETSYIPYLAKEIRDNQLVDFKNGTNDYMFLKCSSEMLLSSLKEICMKAIKKGYDYKRLQIMAPMYKGFNGIDMLNINLQDIFNPQDDTKQQLEVESILYREQDKILQLVNMPEENVFNGDIGTICKIIKASHSESKKNEIYVDFDGNIVKYTPKDFYKIKHGFVMSIHKSQGSEFDFVILPVSHTYRRMLYRKLIYTAVTRAKKKLIIIGEEDAFIYSVSNNNEYIRKTKFCEKLSQICIDDIK